MSERKNDEMQDRHEKILWMTRFSSSDDPNGGNNRSEGSNLSALAFANFSSFFAPTATATEPAKKRVSLASRLKTGEKRREPYIHSSLVKLRSDPLQREEFFRSQLAVISDRQRQARDVGAAHRQHYEEGLQDLSPERLLSSLQHRCSSRDARIAVVQQRKRLLFLAKQGHRQEQVEHARSIGYVLHDPCETLQLPAELTLWRSVMVAWRAVQLFGKAVESNRASGVSPRRSVSTGPAAQAEDAAAPQLPSRRTLWNMNPALALTFVVAVQAWWRGAHTRLLVRKRRRSTKMIVDYLTRVPRIAYHFRFLMKKMLRVVRRIQDHYRAVRLLRMLRRNQGVVLVNKRIRIFIASADDELGKLVKKKKQAEAQYSAAIKARKPIFEAEVRNITKRMTELALHKERLLALTDASKFTEVSRVIYNKETEFRSRIRDVGLQFKQRYAYSVNMKGLLEKRLEEYNANLRRTSVALLTVPSMKLLREESMSLTKPERPAMCVALTVEDVQKMLATTLQERGAADLLLQMEVQYGGGPGRKKPFDIVG
jgi:hypothetical protein